MRSTLVILASLALAACSSTTTTTGAPPGRDAGGSDGASAGPCGGADVYGTFQIQGTLSGTESICGLSLGSFSGGTLTLSKTSAGATVTVTQSGDGHIDVADCAATVSGCTVTTGSCAGSTDAQATVKLDLQISGSSLTGSSQLGFAGCQAPGLSFTGSR